MTKNIPFPDSDRNDITVYVVSWMLQHYIKILKDTSRDAYLDFLVKAQASKNTQEFIGMMMEYPPLLEGIYGLFTKEETQDLHPLPAPVKDYYELIFCPALRYALVRSDVEWKEPENYYEIFKEYFTYLTQHSQSTKEKMTQNKESLKTILQLVVGNTKTLETEEMERKYFRIPLAMNFGVKKAQQFWLDFYEDIMLFPKEN